MAPKRVELSAITGKPKLVRSDRGREAAKRKATMTKDEWQKYQTDKYKEAWPKPEYMQNAPPTRHIRDGGEGAYRDQTYMIVTRWTANTKIQYRPYAKAPGSKSHLRYNAYAGSKTIGESLKRGSYPLDWCYDYEHGFIRVLGGEIREEPIDTVNCEDPKKLTQVDHCLLQWYRRELAKKYGLKVQDLVGAEAGEPMLLRAHRLHANKHAEVYLAKAQRQNRAIREEEVETVLSTWGFARNTTRQNVLPQDKEWVWSDTIGLLRDRCGDIHLTKPTERYPAVCQILCQWLVQRLPAEVKDFKFTTLNLNKNYAAKRHRDGNNFGPSIIKGFGDYQKGELSVFPRDDRGITDLARLPKNDRVEVDIKYNLAMFNGNSAHEVSDYTGERYSVVYFTIGCHDKMTTECRDRLKAIGMPVPALNENPHALLGPPPGYEKRPVARPSMRTSGSSVNSNLATVSKMLRTWPIRALDKRAVSTPASRGGAKKPVLKKLLKKP